MKNTQTYKAAQRGFSLIEVTIALGITAFGITSVLGLLPQSLDQIKKASEAGAEARIYQQIAASISQAEWVTQSGADALAPQFNGRRYPFDGMAQPLPENYNSADLRYLAEVNIEPAGVTLPGGETDLNLRRVAIRLLNTGTTDVDLNTASPLAVRRYSTLVTRTGK